MGFLVPSLVAFGLNACGIYVFHDSSKAGCEPLVSSLIFLFGLFLLLWDLRLFPASLRSPLKLGAVFLHFFISTFIMEHVMNDFWFPLEATMFTFMPKVATYESCILRQIGWNSPGLLNFLKSDISHVLASYTLSVFFLISVLHATRLIDLRLLRCGQDVFFEDITHRMRKTWRKLYKKYFRRVKFQEDCYCDKDESYKRGRKCNY